MKQDQDKDTLNTAWPTLMLFIFGFGILSFLIAIDREEWFHIKPFSGAAQAMFLSSDKNMQNRH